MCWLCEHPGAGPEDYNDYIRQLIARSGWAIQAVERDGPHPPWAYTVGLTSRGLPELVVTGLDPAPAAVLLNAAAEDLQHDGVPEPGTRIRLRDGRAAEVVEVAVPGAHLNVAVALYGDAVTALQLVHASADGRWPWDAGYGGARGGQPVLGARTIAGDLCGSGEGRPPRPGSGNRTRTRGPNPSCSRSRACARQSPGRRS